MSDLYPTNAQDEEIALVDLSDLEKEAIAYAYRSKSKNTVRAYRADWAHFINWCTSCNKSSLPASPETISLYLTYMVSKEKLKTTTIARRIVTISEVHLSRNFETPVRHSAVKAVWDGIKRTYGFNPRGKQPALLKDIKEMINVLPNNLLGDRDRAILLIGFAGAMRRSEIVSLDIDDIRFCSEGLTIQLRFSKTDQEGKGRIIGIPYGEYEETCPVRSYKKWLTNSSISHGPAFRSVNRYGHVSLRRLSDKTVARIVKRSLLLANRDSTHYSGHSLRAGLATQAALCGVPERVIQDQTGHRSLLILRRYIRNGDIFTENAASQIGL